MPKTYTHLQSRGESLFLVNVTCEGGELFSSLVFCDEPEIDVWVESEDGDSFRVEIPEELQEAATFTTGRNLSFRVLEEENRLLPG